MEVNTWRQDQRAFLTYKSKMWVRRRSTLSVNRVESLLTLTLRKTAQSISTRQWEDDVLVKSKELNLTEVFPSFLAISMLAQNKSPNNQCLPAVDEVSGQLGKACGKTNNENLQGTLMGEPFTAHFSANKLLWLKFPKQNAAFFKTEGKAGILPSPPDLFAQAIFVPGIAAHLSAKQLVFTLQPRLDFVPPSSAAQRIVSDRIATRIIWQRISHKEQLAKSEQNLLPFRAQGGPLDQVVQQALQGVTKRWPAAQILSRLVGERITDKRPSLNERNAEQVWKTRQGSCVAHSQLFIQLASRGGLPAREAFGLVATETGFWAHSWVQAKVFDQWYDLEPTLGEAPASAPRILLAVSSGKENSSLSWWTILLSDLHINVAPLP